VTTPTLRAPRLTAADVHATLGQHMLVDGYDIVLDLEKSHGRRLWDARNQRWLLDTFSFFATLPVGLNHPKMKDAEFQAALLRAALGNPSNSDIYTVEMAEFVATFGRVGIPAHLPRLFLIAGGALGVENAIKAAFDWKVRRNMRKGVRARRAGQVLHFREAFHGRTGYTLSMTNTADPRKHQYFPKFDWPRVDNPKLRFPVDAAETERVAGAEQAALAQAKQAFLERKDDIACNPHRADPGRGRRQPPSAPASSPALRDLGTRTRR